MTNFEKAIDKWLKENEFNCGFYFDDDFGFDWVENKVRIGTMGYNNVSRWFEQFLYEYGLEYTGIFDPVLAFFHELGHWATNEVFSDSEKMLFNIAKDFIDDRMENQNNMIKYWEMPDEFAANIWAINYMNNHIEVVESLCQIYVDYWNEFIEERNVA